MPSIQTRSQFRKKQKSQDNYPGFFAFSSWLSQEHLRTTGMTFRFAAIPLPFTAGSLPHPYAPPLPSSVGLVSAASRTALRARL